jgi:hypothetical protein
VSLTITSINLSTMIILFIQDVDYRNILVNVFRGDFEIGEHFPMLTEFRRRDAVLYAHIDFDISIMFEPESIPAERRLPWVLSREGPFVYVYDTRQGELDYDPFAYDIACLGELLCVKFQVCTKVYISQSWQVKWGI